MMSSVMLVCAVLASLALGVLVAYGVCLGMFGAFRFHATSAANARMLRAPARATALEG